MELAASPRGNIPGVEEVFVTFLAAYPNWV